jgi:hypothetical protein
MISEIEYTGPDPRDEPRCPVHDCPLVRGECPACRDEAKAEDHELPDFHD